MQDTVYLKDYKLLLARSDNGFFEPTHYDCEYVDGKLIGAEIVEGDFLYDFIMYIRFSERKKKIIKNKVYYTNGFFEIYQWVTAIHNLLSLSRENSQRLITVLARQSGKSFYARKLLAFVLIFYAKHFDLGIHERFYVIFSNLKKELVKDQLSKLLPEIRKAIDLYNQLYPEEYIEWIETPLDKKIDKKLLGNTTKYQFNRVFKGESYPYAQLDIISLNSNVISAGYTAHLLFIDEAQNVDYTWTSKQAIPFLASTGGSMIAIGTANNDANSALFNYYKSDNIPDYNKVILDWKEIYKYKKLVSEEHANKYKNHVVSEINEKGENSIVIQTEYFCNFEVSDTNFITMRMLRDNNILAEDIETDISYYSESNIYRVGSFDAAVKVDRAIMSTGIFEYTENLPIIKLKDIKILKDLNTLIDTSDLVHRVVEYTEANMLDYLIVDATAGQSYIVELIYREIKKRHLKTQIVPFDYSGRKEKQKMCSFVDGLIAQQRYTIPKESYKEREQGAKGYQLLLEELITLRKKEMSNGYTYEAPSGLHDDVAMTFFMLGYAPQFIAENINQGKEFTIGASRVRLFFRKVDEKVIIKKPKILRNWVWA